jgi:hypothetical protein
VSAIASLQKENIPIKTRAWHPKETFLLMELTRSHPELRQTPMNLVRLYNQFAVRLCVRKKTKLQILKKLSGLKM